jgi:hypothetical protein
MIDTDDPWEGERRELLGRQIADLNLSIEGTLLEAAVRQLYDELESHGLVFRPRVYLSDEWGCPDGTPLIGVPFYLADRRLSRIEEDFAVELESDRDVMRYLRHEAGHAFNYAYRLYDRADWRKIFGPYSRPYRDRYRANPFSHAHVRHILGWYAQKHPDEDFAETFAVWLTPDLDWRAEYAGWKALKKLQYVDRIIREVGVNPPPAEHIRDEPHADDLPVSAMHYTLEEHYQDADRSFPIKDSRIFDGDLRNLFGSASDAPEGEPAGDFMLRHKREIIGRIAYWTGESPAAVRKLLDLMVNRVHVLDLHVRGLEAATLVELTAFATAVIMNYRYTNALDGHPREEES